MISIAKGSRTHIIKKNYPLKVNIKNKQQFMVTQSQDSFLCVFPLTPCMDRKLLDVCSSLHWGTKCIKMISYQKLKNSLPCLSIPLPRQKEQKYPLHSLQKCVIKGTYTGVAVTSCHPLAMFCFNSCSELIPSFRLISARCFSLAANT